MEALHIGETREMISIKHLKCGKRGAAAFAKYAEHSTKAKARPASTSRSPPATAGSA